MARFSVIVVAAGRGERFGDAENKVFAKIGDQPLFLKALQLFCNRDDVCQTILAVGPSDIVQMRSKYGPNIGFMGVKLVEGGAERAETVAKALAEVKEEAEFVAVHDAVRVCLAEQWIDDIFAAAAKNGSAVPVTPVTATIKRVDGQGQITETVSREGLYLAQTPQVFRREVLQAAYKRLQEQGGEWAAMTDDAQVLAAAGEGVHSLDGDPRNIKVTTKGDLSLASAIVKSLPAKPAVRRGAFEEAQW